MRRVTEKLMIGFSEDMRVCERSVATIQKYLRDIEFFRQYVGGRIINKEIVLKYKNELTNKYNLSSANSMLAALNAFLRFAGWADCCVKQFKIQKNAFCSEDKELTQTEYLCLIRAAEKRNTSGLCLLLQTVCATGIRISELGYITVEAVKNGEAVVSCKDKTRRIFIVKELAKRLKRYANEHGIVTGAIFITKSGKPLNRSNVWREMKALCSQAGVSPNKVFPHNLRHLFARTFYSIDKDIAKLADILGHSSINTTRIYIITTGAEHRRKMEKMHLLI